MSPNELEEFEEIVTRLQSDYPELRPARKRVVSLVLGVSTFCLAGLVAAIALGSGEPEILIVSLLSGCYGALVLAGGPRRRWKRVRHS
jgi:hypothetical protein